MAHPQPVACTHGPHPVMASLPPRDIESEKGCSGNLMYLALLPVEASTTPWLAVATAVFLWDVGRSQDRRILLCGKESQGSACLPYRRVGPRVPGPDLASIHGIHAGRIDGVESFYNQAGLAHPGPCLYKSGAAKGTPLVGDGPPILPMTWRNDPRAAPAFFGVDVAYHA